MQLLLLQTGELCQAHIDDGLCLHLIQLEALHQVLLCLLRCLAGTNDVYHFVNIIRGDNQALQDVSAFLGLAQVILGAADNYVVAMLHEIRDAVAQCEQFGATLYQSNAVHGERSLERRHLEQFVHDHLSVGIAFYIHHDTHTFAVRLVVHVRNAFQLLLVGQLCNILNQLGLIYAIGNLREHDGVVSVATLDFAFGSHDDAPAAGFIGILYSLYAHDVGTRGEVGTLHPLHQLKAVKRGVVDEGDAGVEHLGEVVGGNVGGHTHGNTRSAVDQQVGYLCGHHGGFLQRIVEVVHHIHRFLVQLVHHGLAHQRKAALGVTHGCSTVTVDRTEVPLAVDQRVAHVPLLSHAYQSAVYRAVAMGVVLTQHLTHDTGALLVRLIVYVIQALHSIQDATMDGFESVAHVGQCTGHDYRHRVVDIRFPHFMLNVYFNNSVFCVLHVYLY